MIGVAILVIGVLIALIWIFVEVKRFRHKLFAIFLILLIVFTYFSFTHVMKNNDIDYKSVSGLIGGGKIYFTWLASAFGNMKTITTNAVHMDWGGNKTSET